MKRNRCLTGLLPMLIIGALVAVVMVVSGTSPDAWALTMTKETCQRCHGTDQAVIVSWHHQIRDANNWTCTMCHKTISDGTGGYTVEIQRDCTVCHTPGYHTEPAGTNANRHHAIRNANDYGCLHCHPIVQDESGNSTVVVTRDCFFCHTDNIKPWREVKWLTDLPTPTSPETAATITDVTSKFHDTLMYESFDIVNTSTLDKAFTVRLDKDAATTSKVTLGFYVFELPNLKGTIRIYPYLFDGVTVDTSTYLDFRVNVADWVQCDVTSLAMKMSGYTWMKFRVTSVDNPLLISEGAFQIIRPDTVGTNKIPIPEAGADLIVYTGDTVNFSGMNSIDPDGSIVSYDWDFGDGSYGSGQNSSHVYTTPGVYLVALKVRDNLGAVAEDYAFVTVKTASLPPNQPPIANAGPDVVAVVGLPITLSAAGSSDPDGQIYSWTWSFDDGTSASGETVTKVYQAPGTYVATLTVVDNQREISTDQVVIIVQTSPTGNAAPISNAGPDTYASVGEPVIFNGTGSSDKDGTIVSYAWDFGDGTTGTGVSPTKTYTTDGVYVVTLIVTDNVGARGIDAMLMTIHPTITQNKPPVASAGPDRTVTALQNTTFSATGSSDSDGTIASYSWNFGDGTYATGMTITKAYTSAGSFTAALTVTDDKGATATDTAIISVNPPPNYPPVANAGADVTATTKDVITFSGAASTDRDGTISSYVWNFGDNTSANGITTTKTYATAGTYTVTLTVTDNLGATATDTAMVTVTLPPNVLPTANAGPDVTALSGQAITFSGAGSTDSDGTIASYSWAYGDGTTGTGVSPTKTYTTAGTYTVTLTVTDNSGGKATDTAVVTVTANKPPVANAGPDQTATVNKAVSFSAAASSDPDGTIASYSWNFGNGSTGTGATVTKTYTSTGTYTVTLTVTDNLGAKSTDTAIVTVVSNQSPVANAGPDVTATTGQTITFSGAGSTDPDGTISTYSWNFGDGSSTKTGVSTTKSYTTAGTYTVTLTVTDNGGKTATDTARVTVAANKVPVANAGPDVSTAVNKAVTFSGAASTDPDGTIASYSWNFGDGTSGIGVSPTKTYTTAGTYTVTLTVTDNAGGRGTDTAIVTVAANKAPVANAGADLTTTIGQAITLSGAASSDADGTITSYAWTFGDGTSGTGVSATKTYTTAGTYTVTLTVTDDSGAKASDTAIVTVTANKPPVANAGADVSATTGQTITFSGAGSSDSDGTIASYAWSFGDGTSGTGVSPTKSYTAAGTYTVTLTVTDNAGGKATDTAVVTVTTNKPPVANAGADVAAKTGQSLTFSGAASSDSDGTIASYSWNFGDGTSAAGASVTRSYATAGTYTVTLTVTDNSGATATDTAVVTVTANKPPVANAGADVPAKTGQVITFSGAASSDPDGTIASYSWNFGDGSSAAGASVTKSYATAGTYTVTLTITDNSGATATDTAIVTVTANKPPVANAGADVTAATGQTITFSGTPSTDSDGTITSYSWNFGDGTSATGVSATKSYTAVGTYTVTLTVTDNNGATATDTAVVTVTAAPVYVPADLGQQIANLNSRTTADTSGAITDITAKLRDAVLTDTYKADNRNVVTMKVNRDANTTTQVILRVYISNISGSQTLRIYPYNSNGTSVVTSSYVDATASAKGWKEIDVTALAAKMKGFGWMKFRITDNNSVSIAEGNFTIR